MIICIWGVLLESLMVATISEFLNFNDAQANSYAIIERLYFMEDLTQAAIHTIEQRQQFVIKERKKADYQFEDNRVKKLKAKKATKKALFWFVKKLHMFQQKQSEFRQFEDHSEVTYLAKKIENLEIMIEKHEEVHNEYLETQEDIFFMLSFFYDKKLSDEQRERFNHIAKQKETKRWLEEIKRRDQEEAEEEDD